MNLILAATYHDPDGRLYTQFIRALPTLTAVFSGVAIQASAVANSQTLQLLADYGAVIQQTTADHDKGAASLGRSRRHAIALALGQDAEYIVLCDGDRALHWAEFYPDELAEIAQFITEYDFTVIGRTPRAFARHPYIQTDTERIVNRVFAQLSGLAWDITAATRGLSRDAAAWIVNKSRDDSLGVDGSWPLLLQRQGGFKLGYAEIEGMEFETADRYQAEIAAVGGYQNWLIQLNADPQKWLHRLDLARIEIEAMMNELKD